MKKIFFAFSILFLLMQCTENEAENVVLPKLVSLAVSQLGNSQDKYLVEFKGKFIGGKYPLKNIKLVNGLCDFDYLIAKPGRLTFDKDVELIDANTFKVEMEIEEYWLNNTYCVAFYFDAGTMANYSDTYGYNYFSNSLVHVYPKE